MPKKNPSPAKSKPAAGPSRKKSSRPARPAVRAVRAPAVPPLAKRLIKVLEDQKVENIRVVPLENHVADAFVICTTTGPRHLHSAAENLIQAMKAEGVLIHHVEGYGASAPSERWVLVDFSDVIVHLFTEEGRRFYDLERLYEESR